MAYDQVEIELADARVEIQALRSQLQEEPEDDWSEHDPNRVSL